MGYYVSRQCYYYSGERIVEVTSGGFDYAGCDMLPPRYAGEGREYEDPREAVEAAISICREWRKEYKGRFPRVGFGCTGGMGLEVEGDTFASARKAAREVWEHLPKCPMCGEPLPAPRKRLRPFDCDEDMCSERCAERWAADMQVEETEQC